MQVTLTIPTYDPFDGIRISWVEGHEIKVTGDCREMTIEANSAGLTTLALQMLTLAQEGIPVERHIHLTNVSGLNEESLDLTLTKK